MNSKPLVSVITIFLNEEKFIEETIQSIFAQTYDNWELLLVDDGSTDKSTQIAQKYAEQNPGKVHYLEHDNHQNRGMSATRNLGVSKAQGEYIAFLDADDIWLPQKLEKQVAILDSQPEAGMLYGRTHYWHSWTGNPEDIERDSKLRLGVEPNTLVKPPTLLTLRLQDKADPPGNCSTLFRRETIEEVGGFEESFRGMFEDQVFYSKVWLNTPVFVESGSWDRYRLHPNSTCHVASDRYSGHLTFLSWLEKYLSKQEIQDTEIWQALKTQLLPYRHPNLYNLLKLTNYLKGRMKGLVKSITKGILPASIYSRLQAQWHGVEYRPPVGKVKFGSLRRITPLSKEFGFDRGLPVDRYYVENFLTRQGNDIRGRVLEIGDNSYTMQFGGDRVTKSDVLHVVEGNPDATIVGDLSNAGNIPSEAFDCLVLTQTLHLIFDVRSAIKTIYRILKPGGVALITFPGISQLSIDEWKDYWCWGFTTDSAQRLFEEFFPKTNVKVECHGNVLAATSFLQGLASQELQKKELDYCDPTYQVVVTVRIVKPEIEQ